MAQTYVISSRHDPISTPEALRDADLSSVLGDPDEEWAVVSEIAAAIWRAVDAAHVRLTGADEAIDPSQESHYRDLGFSRAGDEDTYAIAWGSIDPQAIAWDVVRENA